jgi:hypothetical protein
MEEKKEVNGYVVPKEAYEELNRLDESLQEGIKNMEKFTTAVKMLKNELLNLVPEDDEPEQEQPDLALRKWCIEQMTGNHIDTPESVYEWITAAETQRDLDLRKWSVEQAAKNGQTIEGIVSLAKGYYEFAMSLNTACAVAGGKYNK